MLTSAHKIIFTFSRLHQWKNFFLVMLQDWQKRNSATGDFQRILLNFCGQVLYRAVVSLRQRMMLPKEKEYASVLLQFYWSLKMILRCRKMVLYLQNYRWVFSCCTFHLHQSQPAEFLCYFFAIPKFDKTTLCASIQQSRNQDLTEYL